MNLLGDPYLKQICIKFGQIAFAAYEKWRLYVARDAVVDVSCAAVGRTSRTDFNQLIVRRRRRRRRRRRLVWSWVIRLKSAVSHHQRPGYHACDVTTVISVTLPLSPCPQPQQIMTRSLDADGRTSLQLKHLVSFQFRRPSPPRNLSQLIGFFSARRAFFL